MINKKVSWNNIILAFIISLAVFGFGIYVGGYTTNIKFQSLYDLQNKIRSDVMGTELQYLIVSDNVCSQSDMDSFIDEIVTLGNRLSSMESQLGVDNQAVISLKEYYNLLEIRHYLFMKDIQKECNKTKTLVLYFYSNAGDCSDCEEQGYVLSYVNKDKSLNVYSLDVNIDNPAIRALKKIYNITKTPSIVINEKVYLGFQNKDKLLKIFSE